MPISPFSNSRRDTPVAACQTKIKSVGESSIRLAAMVILATAVLAKVVGFMREAVIAATYGTSHVVDIYLAGISFPAMAATIVFHFIPNAFIPFFSETNSDEQTHRQAWGVLGLACLISAGMWWLAGPLASLFLAGRTAWNFRTGRRFCDSLLSRRYVFVVGSSQRIHDWVLAAMGTDCSGVEFHMYRVCSCCYRACKPATHPITIRPGNSQASLRDCFYWCYCLFDCKSRGTSRG